MITKRELDYVNSWANRVPYPGLSYSTKAMEALVKAYEDYHKYYDGKEYDIILSNAEQLQFEIQRRNLCHMLGIDYKNLTGDYLEEYKEDILGINGSVSSYDLLSTVIKKTEDILRYDYDNGGKVINYYRIMIKCGIFDKLSDFSRFNFGVINFNKELYEKINNTSISINSGKLLYVQSNEAVAPYFMMGIKKDNKEENDKYIVETLMSIIEPEKFFNNQEVVIPTQILITTPDKMEKLEASPEEKIALLNQYKSIITSYKLPNKLNVYGDYESMLTEEARKRVRTNA